MKKRLLLSLSLAAAMIAGGGSAVLAGSKSLGSLTINAASRYANGGFAETHNTANLTEYAECGTNATTGYCTFRDAGGTYYSCMTTDPALLTVIRSMSDESYFSVRWDAAAVCTSVLSYASSRTEAKDH